MQRILLSISDRLLKRKKAKDKKHNKKQNKKHTVDISFSENIESTTPLNVAPAEPVDDTHKRWSNLSDNETYAWNYFNNIVAKSIISKTPEEKISLASLYQKLALARAKCESIKLQIDECSEDKIVALMKDINVKFPKNFGNFQYGFSDEHDVLNENGFWGPAIAKLVKQRLSSSNQVSGLNTYFQSGVYHPFGTVLNSIKPVFG